MRVRGKLIRSTVTVERVEERARELALVARRTSKQVTGSDRRQAKRELLGASYPASRAGSEETRSGSQWGSPPTSSGRRVRSVRPHDDQVTEKLVEEGVEEAEHDQMVAARKSGK
jgi:hypothetical protein